MDPAPVQRGLERDDLIPVASVYPASVNGLCACPGPLMDFRASSSPYRFAGLKGPWKFTGSEDAGSDRFAINIARSPSQPLASTPVFDFLPSGRGRCVCSHTIGVAARQQCPHHSCVLVGEGHRHFKPGTSGEQALDPRIGSRCLRRQQRRLRRRRRLA